jgi:hypothetical protein
MVGALAVGAYAAACGGPATAGGPGADCFRATECELGLVCIDHKCTNDVSSIDIRPNGGAGAGATGGAAGDDGGPGATAGSAGAGGQGGPGGQGGSGGGSGAGGAGGSPGSGGQGNADASPD